MNCLPDDNPHCVLLPVSALFYRRTPLYKRGASLHLTYSLPFFFFFSQNIHGSLDRFNGLLSSLSVIANFIFLPLMEDVIGVSVWERQCSADVKKARISAFSYEARDGITQRWV